jgi:hypothetical protein
MDKWIKIEDKYPTPFDLVKIIDEKENTQYAWWTGHGWDARDLKVENPIAWKRKSDG